ncbi:MAG TPA: FecR domain-containing protein [Chitinophaga sp.]|nr:FecR domain-containing protein [Chitinophaga sp.]
MEHQDSYYRELAEKWQNGIITPEERRILEEWYNQGQDEPVHIPPHFAKGEEEHKHRMLTSIRKKIAAQQKPVRRYWYAAAAILLLCSIAGGYWLMTGRSRPTEAFTHSQTVTPGANKASLTLADGSVITLDSNTNKVLQQGISKVVNSAGGQLTYQVAGEEQNNALLVFNTLTTPRGGQYKLTLPDGSKVWLNAASSIRFPTAFAGQERKVEVSGEAYFEVAKAASMPFRVVTKGMTIEVLGTHFNVNAYEDDPENNTTLMEGRIKVIVNDTHAEQLLQPGQQSKLGKDGSFHLLSNVDVEEALAWKNGYFQFNGENIRSVMKKLARWYDVDVEFRGNMDGKDFEGTISRFERIDEVLRILSMTGLVHFKTEGRRIIVMT